MFELLLAFIAIIVVGMILTALSVCLWWLLSLIKCDPLRVLITVALCVLFLPFMLLGQNAMSLTEFDKKWGTFSWNLHLKSRTTVILFVVYAVIYFELYQHFFG